MNFLHLSMQLSLSEEFFSSLAVYKHDTFKNHNNTILRKDWGLAFFFFLKHFIRTVTQTSFLHISHYMEAVNL